jgi:hypothetical protein
MIMESYLNCTYDLINIVHHAIVPKADHFIAEFKSC